MREHSQKYPAHRLVVLASTTAELGALADEGVAAILANHNIFISEKTFRPIPEIPREFDAIYNARFFKWKRHELAALIDRVAYLGYAFIDKATHAESASIVQSLLALAPAHQILNPLRDNLPVRLSPEDVNAAYARAHVGLCLSSVEGQMYASIEYLLAGLPVVSTPSIGGRDVFFDPEVCIVADDNPAAIRDAVAALKARSIPRDEVRARALALMTPHRERMLNLLDDTMARGGGEPRFGKIWPFKNKLFVWRSANDHLASFEGLHRRAG